MTSTTTSTTTTCAAELNANAVVLWTMMFVSLFIIVVASFYRTRKSFRLHCCNGRPGPVVPLNMLDSYKRRKSYALSFCVTVSQVFIIICTGDYGYIFGSKGNAMMQKLPTLSVLVKLVCAVVFSQIGYPLMICHTMRNRLVGSLIGLILCTLWISLEAWKLSVVSSNCWGKWSTKFGIMRTTWNYPLYISLILLAAKYLCTLVKTVQKRQENRSNGELANWLNWDDTDWKKDYIYIHVKRLLIPGSNGLKQDDAKTGEVGLAAKFRRRLKSKIYTNNPGFKYSTRMVIIFSVSMLAIFMMVILTMYAFEYQFEIQKTPSSYILKMRCALYIATGITILISVMVLLNCFTCYRRHCLMLRRGDRSFLPKSLRNNEGNPKDIMVSAFKFAGYQVAYVIASFAVNIMVIIIICLLVIYLPSIMPPSFIQKLLLMVLKAFGPGILTVFIFTQVQGIIIPICFMIDTERLLINNRRAFHIYSYYMFFFNLFAGLGSILMRIGIAFIYGLLFLPRLQKSNLPQQVEERDPGYMAYISYLLLEHQHANPVLQCFVRLLLETQNKKISESEDDVYAGQDVVLRYLDNLESAVTTRAVILSKRRVRIRWRLYAMLLQNPSLTKYRSHRLLNATVDVEEGIIPLTEVRSNPINSNASHNVSPHLVSLRNEVPYKSFSRDLPS